MRNFVEALNAIHPNVYGYTLILAGCVLTIIQPSADLSKELIVGGFALITGNALKGSNGGGPTQPHD